MKRNCLKCNREFESLHKGNRICSQCNFKNTSVARIDTQNKQGKRDNIKGLRD